MLANIPFFVGVDPALLARIESAASHRAASTGEFIFFEGDAGNCMFVLVSGSVGVYRKVGSESKKLATLTAGDFFGELALVTDEPRKATVSVESDAELLCISKDLFQEIFGVNPELSLRIGEAIMQRTEANNLDDMKIAQQIHKA